MEEVDEAGVEDGGTAARDGRVVENAREAIDILEHRRDEAIGLRAGRAVMAGR